VEHDNTPRSAANDGYRSQRKRQSDMEKIQEIERDANDSRMHAWPGRLEACHGQVGQDVSKAPTVLHNRVRSIGGSWLAGGIRAKGAVTGRDTPRRRRRALSGDGC